MKEKGFFDKKGKLPIIFQEEIAECGHACVAMISGYFGHQLDLSGLRKVQPPSLKGVNLLDLIQLLERLHFRTRALKMPLSELASVPCPAIIHWNTNHFVVLKKVGKRKVTVHDPALGVCHYSFAEVAQSFTGIVLEVQKVQPECVYLPSEQKPGLWYWMREVRGIKKSLFFLGLFSLTMELLSLINPLLIQYVTDDVIGSSSLTNLYVIAIGFILLLFFQLAIQYLRGQLVVFLTSSLTEQWASNIMQHLLKLPLSFFEKRQKGDIQAKFNAIEQIQRKISTDFVNTILDGLMIMLHLMIMLLYSALLTALCLLFTSIYCLIRYFSYQTLKQHMEKSITQHAKAASVFLETLRGILPLKAYNKERTYFNFWRNHYIAALNADVKVSRLQVLFTMLNQWLTQGEYLVLVCMGAVFILAHQCTLGMLMAFLSYRHIVSSKFMTFIQNVLDYKLISIQLTRLNDILVQEEEETKKKSLFLSSTKEKGLSVQNVGFSYEPTGSPILKGLSLTLLPGEKVVITGASGCGKSTLLKVMMGLLKKTSGELKINGVAIEDFGIEQYRQLTASVLQEDSLLCGSILDNITFFDEQIDFDAVVCAAQYACIHETINQFPMGYETLVGDMGSVLSGGQRQRILLARALYKKPQFLFLDEATSHLDVETEMQINLALKQLDITQIIIAHRKETIAMADRIIAFEAINGGN